MGRRYVDKILEATAPEFYFNDPQQGAIPRDNFKEYFEGFKKQVGHTAETLMNLSGVIAYEAGELLMACCTLKTGANKAIVGNGLITVVDGGVRREDAVLI